MRKLWLFLQTRWVCLLAVALFWAAVLLTNPPAAGACASAAAEAWALGVLLSLIVCSFLAALLLSDSLVSNFVVIALLVGLFLVVAQPFAHPMDEEYHFLRAFDLTNGRFLPREAGGFVPAGYEAYAERARWTLAGVFEAPALWFAPVEKLSFVARLRAASYLPLAYIPAALGIGLGRLLRLPLVWIVLLGRTANYLFYTALCALALSRTKKLRSLLFLTALCTGVMSFLGTLSTDLPLLGGVLLFVSICFHYCFDEDAGARIKASDIVLLTLSAALIVSIKYFGYALVVPLVLFIPRKTYENRNPALWLIAAAVAAIAAIQIYALLRYRGSVDATGRADTNVRMQLAYMLENPLRCLTMLFQDMFGNLFERVLGQRGSSLEVFGAIGSLGALLPLAGALLAEDRPALSASARRRYALYALLAACVMQAVCSLALYLSWTPVGESTIWSVQPRYTLPFYILILLAVSMLRVNNGIKAWPRIISFLTLLNVLNVAAGLRQFTLY